MLDSDSDNSLTSDSALLHSPKGGFCRPDLLQLFICLLLLLGSWAGSEAAFRTEDKDVRDSNKLEVFTSDAWKLVSSLHERLDLLLDCFIPREERQLTLVTVEVVLKVGSGLV